MGDGLTEARNAFITVHRPRESNGTAVVICPGGGYQVLMMEPEGHGIARWLNQHGITGIVLRYRLPQGHSDVPLLDAQRAVRMVRAHADEWQIDPDRIGVLGFSAGGHLAASAGTHFDAGNPAAGDPLDRISCRPDFMILIYPAIYLNAEIAECMSNFFGPDPEPSDVEYFSLEKQATDHTPPAFLAHALDDEVVSPDHSRLFHEALKAHGVPTEYLQLPGGGHGLDGYQGPMWDAWQAAALQWLVTQGMMRSS